MIVMIYMDSQMISYDSENFSYDFLAKGPIDVSIV